MGTSEKKIKSRLRENFEAVEYLYHEKGSPIIEACGRYLDNPYGQGFYNIIAMAKREPALEFYLKQYQEMDLPNPDIKWCFE